MIEIMLLIVLYIVLTFIGYRFIKVGMNNKRKEAGIFFPLLFLLFIGWFVSLIFITGIILMAIGHVISDVAGWEVDLNFLEKK